MNGRKRNGGSFFRQVNASCAIEGIVMTAEDLALQEQLIRGEITHEEAIITVRGEYGMEAPTSPGNGRSTAAPTRRVRAEGPTSSPL